MRPIDALVNNGLTSIFAGLFIFGIIVVIFNVLKPKK